jgi:hypothetical protein
VTTLQQYLNQIHHRAGWLWINLLMLPILAWVWLAAREPVVSVFNGAVPRHVLSGELFTTPLNPIHAGSALDQPTIGKWLFLFSVMAISGLLYAAGVRWLSNRANRSGLIAYAVCITILGVFLLCMLSWPILWLIQYVWSMGFTSMRTFGLLYGIAGGLLVIGFMWTACRKPKAPEAEPAGEGDALQRA